MVYTEYMQLTDIQMKEIVDLEFRGWAENEPRWNPDSAPFSLTYAIKRVLCCDSNFPVQLIVNYWHDLVGCKCA